MNVLTQLSVVHILLVGSQVGSLSLDHHSNSNGFQSPESLNRAINHTNGMSLTELRVGGRTRKYDMIEKQIRAKRHSQATEDPRSRSCPTGYFVCNSSLGYCVERMFQCDDHEDCPDGSDEWNCSDLLKEKFYNELFQKRPDEDREKETRVNCNLRHPPARCRCAATSLFCEVRNFTSIPSHLDINVTELDLSANTLNRKDIITFPVSLPNLEILILTSSKIRSLSRKSFGTLPSPLPALRSLYLVGNNLTALRAGSFAGLVALQNLYISHNPIEEVEVDSFHGLVFLQELDLRNCRLRLLTKGMFNGLIRLKKLLLAENMITNVFEDAFHSMGSLEMLTLARNQIWHISVEAFSGLRRLETLSLRSNQLQWISGRDFQHLLRLSNLDLKGNEIKTIEMGAFDSLVRLKSLDLRENRLKNFSSALLTNQHYLTHIYFDEFQFCAIAISIRVCEPRGDGISSVAHLLDNEFLRVSVWVVALVSCVGNLSVLLGRMLIREPNLVHSLYIKNLAVADMLMGVYLLVIAIQDGTYRGEYIRHEWEWRTSWLCRGAGILSTLSCESSVAILTVITLDRYMSIVYPLTGGVRGLGRVRTLRPAIVVMGITWMIALVVSLLPVWPVLEDYFGQEFYSHNGVCLPLHIHQPYAQGWEYSLFIIVVLNLSAFGFILYAYGRMFHEINVSSVGLVQLSSVSSYMTGENGSGGSSSGGGGRNGQATHDHTIAKRFAFIVAADFLCWVPLIIIKIVALSGMKINEDLSAWVAVFILPVNAALNPILYTLTTQMFKQELVRMVYRLRSFPSFTDTPNSGGQNGVPDGNRFGGYGGGGGAMGTPAKSLNGSRRTSSSKTKLVRQMATRDRATASKNGLQLQNRSYEGPFPSSTNKILHTRRSRMIDRFTE